MRSRSVVDLTTIDIGLGDRVCRRAQDLSARRDGRGSRADRAECATGSREALFGDTEICECHVACVGRRERVGDVLSDGERRGVVWRRGLHQRKGGRGGGSHCRCRVRRVDGGAGVVGSCVRRIYDGSTVDIRLSERVARSAGGGRARRERCRWTGGRRGGACAGERCFGDRQPCHRHVARVRDRVVVGDRVTGRRRGRGGDRLIQTQSGRRTGECSRRCRRVGSDRG